MTQSDRFPVPELSDVEVAFPANVLDWIPARDDIPKEFRFMGSSEWSQIARALFLHGLPADVKFHPRDGVDPEKAIRALRALLGSYALKHEHKEEAAAFLMSEWFTKIEGWQRDARSAAAPSSREVR